MQAEMHLMHDDRMLDAQFIFKRVIYEIYTQIKSSLCN